MSGMVMMCKHAVGKSTATSMPSKSETSWRSQIVPRSSSSGLQPRRSRILADAATSGEPLRAMQHVLDQVDAWVAKGDGARQ